MNTMYLFTCPICDETWLWHQEEGIREIRADIQGEHASVHDLSVKDYLHVCYEHDKARLAGGLSN